MTLEQVKNKVVKGFEMRDFQGNLITDWETFHSIYGIHENTLEKICKAYAQSLVESKDKEIEEMGVAYMNLHDATDREIDRLLALNEAGEKVIDYAYNKVYTLVNTKGAFKRSDCETDAKKLFMELEAYNLLKNKK